MAKTSLPIIMEEVRKNNYAINSTSGELENEIILSIKCKVGDGDCYLIRHIKTRSPLEFLRSAHLVIVSNGIEEFSEDVKYYPSSEKDIGVKDIFVELEKRNLGYFGTGDL